MDRKKLYLSTANQHGYDWHIADPPQGVYVTKGFWCADWLENISLEEVIMAIQEALVDTRIPYLKYQV